MMESIILLGIIVGFWIGLEIHMYIEGDMK